MAMLNNQRVYIYILSGIIRDKAISSPVEIDTTQGTYWPGCDGWSSMTHMMAFFCNSWYDPYIHGIFHTSIWEWWPEGLAGMIHEDLVGIHRLTYRLVAMSGINSEYSFIFTKSNMLCWKIHQLSSLIFPKINWSPQWLGNIHPPQGFQTISPTKAP